MEQLTASKYRYDLDGLRGLAIAFVVIFHVFVGRVSGGVDVFLLLSGYFFLGAQLRYAVRETADPNPLWPLWRTIRRLVPSLALTVGATAAAVYFLTPELRNLNLARQFEAAMGYFLNWEIAAQGAAYSAAQSQVSPLQHLWSMAVQGQFYLFAITLGSVVAWWARRRRRYAKSVSPARLAGPLLILLTAASFGYAWYLSMNDQLLNYYSTFSRFWELCLGAVLALYASRVSLPAQLRAACGIVGVLMVLSTGLLFDGATLFPGPATLYPIGGAVLVVLSGGAGVRWLASPWMRWLGRIAYPLYLWHWPLLIISTVYLNLHNPTLVLGVCVIAASVILAELTHRCVEEPLKQHGKRPVAGERRCATALQQVRVNMAARGRAFGGLVVALVVISTLYVPLLWRAEVAALADVRLDPVRYPGVAATSMSRVPAAEPMPDPYLLADLVSPAWSDGCMSLLHDDPKKLAVDFADSDCIYGDRQAETLMVMVGGSHAEQWMAPLDKLGKQHGFKIIPLVRQGCPAFVEEKDRVFSEDCKQFNQVMIKRLEKLNPDLVFSTATRPLLEAGRFLDEVPKSYVTLWDYLAQRNIAFVGVRDNPWFLNPDGTGQMVSQCFAETGDISQCGRLKEHVYAPVNPAAKYQKRPDFVAVDTADWFCPVDTCPPVIGNIYVYRDGNHMGDDFALTLAPLLWEQMRPVVELVKHNTRVTTPHSMAPSSAPSAPPSTTSSSSSSTTAQPTPASPSVVATSSPQPTPVQSYSLPEWDREALPNKENQWVLRHHPRLEPPH
ncbi:acyltransferase family protein [Corynebacterium felinum]|uniref:Peptidoglycan/LPS O-acetylase OafA/YrhL n=1 Tax=Corynebacterium felinum TaxID=131318 RepID=A0ABU2BA41_9CORY|nr:acyltransferase family protein [Corynebacterium felinum]MDF5820215.1 acyltransferase family protein [Corynebacterium felinum]MDR7354854.1 peptidoglycan/LPS O-acetylase OafA/YrhL [Corynebacterium felinum]WJY94214.1 O-acetyltransferase OatA [Corynebacterium felinum]